MSELTTSDEIARQLTLRRAELDDLTRQVEAEETRLGKAEALGNAATPDEEAALELLRSRIRRKVTACMEAETLLAEAKARELREAGLAARAELVPALCGLVHAGAKVDEHLSRLAAEIERLIQGYNWVSPKVKGRKVTSDDETLFANSFRPLMQVGHVQHLVLQGLHARLLHTGWRYEHAMGGGGRDPNVATNVQATAELLLQFFDGANELHGLQGLPGLPAQPDVQPNSSSQADNDARNEALVAALPLEMPNGQA